MKAANLALVVALTTGISASWSTIVSMFGSWVIVAAIIIILAGALGLLPGLLLGGKRAGRSESATSASEPRKRPGYRTRTR